MIISVYLPLVAAFVIGRCVATGRFLPRHSGLQTWTISVGCVTAALLSSWSLVLLAMARIDRVAYVTERAHLEGTLLRRTDHVPLPVAVVAIVLLAVRARRVAVSVVRARRARFAADRFRAKHPGSLIVVADDEPLAFALAGRRGRCGVVVVSTALLSGVSIAERRAVLAHENAHLKLRHHAHRGAVNLAVALEPSLKPAAAASARAIERCADDHAGTDATQRRTAANAISTFIRLAIPWSGATPPAAQLLGGLAHADNDAEHRIDALLEPPPPRRLHAIAPMIAVFVATLLATGDATQQLAHLFHAALR